MENKSSNIVFSPPMAELPKSMELTEMDKGLPVIKCCLCGMPMQTNSTNTCIQCLSSKVDITEGITKQGILHYCKQCSRYMGPPWMKCELESKELLSLCLKKIKGLGKVKLIDAGFVWTEPHSKRVKVKLVVQKEFMTAILQSTFVVELIVEYMQCDDCKKTWTPHTWNSCLQVRQKADHKRTIMFLEQLILKYNMHSRALNVKEMPDGIDFFFSNKSDALMLSDFVQSQAVSRSRSSKQLVSADYTNNNYNYKHTFYTELASVSREDLVLLPKKLQRQLGGVSPICLVIKVGSMIQLLDVVTLRTYNIDGATYWSNEFKPLCSRKHLSEFVIRNIESVSHPSKNTSLSKYDRLHENSIVEVELQRLCDYAQNETIFFTKTHLGSILNIDNHVWAYDLNSLNLPEVEGIKDKIPDVVIVKKHFVKRRSKGNRRIWKLKHIEKEAMEDKEITKKQLEKGEQEYEDFMQELEESPELRSNINLYRDEEAIAALTKQMEGLDVEGTKEKEKMRLEEKRSTTIPRKARRLIPEHTAKEVKKEEEKEKVEEDSEDEEGYPEVKLSELLSELKIEDPAESKPEVVIIEKKQVQ